MQLQLQVFSSTGAQLTGESLSYTSANQSVATVSSSGLITGVGDGTTNITVRSNRTSSVTAVATVQVRDAVVSVEVRPPEAVIAVGETVQLQVSATGQTGNAIDLGGRSVTFESSNATIASVSASGVVTGLSNGGAEIFVAVDGVGAPPVPVEVMPFSPTCFAGEIGLAEALVSTLEANDACRRNGGEYFKIWSFQAFAGQRVQIELTSGFLESDGWIQDPLVFLTPAGTNFLLDDRVVLDFDDDGGPGYNSRMLITIPASSEYWIFASTWDSGVVGAYRLSLLREGQWVEVTFDNQLLHTMDIYVNGDVIGHIFGEEAESFFIPPVLTMNLFAFFNFYGPNLFDEESNLGFRWDDRATGAGQTEEFSIDNVVGDNVFFVPLVTNNSGVGLDFVVNWGRDQEVRCCEVDPGEVDYSLWYHLLFDNTDMRAFVSGSGYSGNFHWWRQGVDFTANDISSPAGELWFAVNSAPVSGEPLPPVGRRGAASPTDRTGAGDGPVLGRLDASGRAVPASREELEGFRVKIDARTKRKRR